MGFGNQRNTWRVQLAATLVSAALLGGCGGDGGPPGGAASGPSTVLSSVSISETSPMLGLSETLVFRFNGSVDTSSFALGGTLAGEAAGTWSSSAQANDTYTVKPASGFWNPGSGRTISVTAHGVLGGTASVNATFNAGYSFDPNPSASFALGQPDLTSDAPATSATGLNGPVGIALAPSGRVYVADYFNNRVVGFDTLAAGAPASVVLGEPDFVTNHFAVDQASLPSPLGMAIGAGKMAVAERDVNRVVVFNAIPASSGTVPDVVLGQADFTQSSSGCSATALNQVTSVSITPDGKLLAADQSNNRILIWNSIPTTNAGAADLVLGQSSFTTCVANDDDQNGSNDGVPTARTLSSPTDVWSDGQRLVVLDSLNHRALIWNTMPTTNFQPADVVIGQGSFDKFTADDADQDGNQDPTPSAKTLGGLFTGIAVSGDQLAIADASNQRVLVWNHFPTSNFTPADYVLGQPSFTTRGYPATNAQTLSGPSGLLFHQGKLFVTDSGGGHRVLAFPSR